MEASLPAQEPSESAPLHIRHFACTSWLLDPQLAELLPPTSNIVQFQRRFELISVDTEARSASVFEHVFHRPDLDRAAQPDFAGLPRNTRLERALLAHYEAGKRIHPGYGVMRAQ